MLTPEPTCSCTSIFRLYYVSEALASRPAPISHPRLFTVAGLYLWMFLCELVCLDHGLCPRGDLYLIACHRASSDTGASRIRGCWSSCCFPVLRHRAESYLVPITEIAHPHPAIKPTENDVGHALSQSSNYHSRVAWCPRRFTIGISGVQNVMIVSSSYTGIHLSMERRRVGGGGMADIYLAIIACRHTGAGARRVAPARGQVVGREGESAGAAGTPAALRKLNSIFVIGFFLVLL